MEFTHTAGSLLHFLSSSYFTFSHAAALLPPFPFCSLLPPVDPSAASSPLPLLVPKTFMDRFIICSYKDIEEIERSTKASIKDLSRTHISTSTGTVALTNLKVLFFEMLELED
ncbi:hypothetical protein ACS0TY_015516 [Phlomoides rotata]